MKEPDHFRWRDLKPMLLDNGWPNAVQEIEMMEKEIYALATKRRERLQELLKDVVYNHQTGAHKSEFRPCHSRKLDTLEVHTEFWFV